MEFNTPASVALLLFALLACTGMSGAAVWRRANRDRAELTDHHAALQLVRDAFMRLNGRGQIVETNTAATILFGRETDDILTRRATDLFVDHEQSGADRLLTRAVFAPPYDRTHAYNLTAVRRDGQRFPVEVRFLGESHANLGHTLWLIQDMSRDRELERLRLSEERYKSSQTFANIGTWDWTIDTEDLHWSAEIAPLFGLPPGTKPSYSLFCASLHPEDRERVQAQERACIENDVKHDVEYRVLWPDGQIRWLRETGNVLRDETGKAQRMIGVVRDITEQKDTEQRFQHLAFHDPLTGLPNRGLFEQRLDLAAHRARRHKSGLALAFIDLFRFKAINDTHGHAVGDKVLVEISDRLKNSVRATDTVARIGGDEFVVVLEDVKGEEEVRSLAEKLITLVSAPIPMNGQEHSVGVSLGVCLCPETEVDVYSLIHNADMAMYEAKAAGENQYRIVTHDE